MSEITLKDWERCQGDSGGSAFALTPFQASARKSYQKKSKLTELGYVEGIKDE